MSETKPDRVTITEHGHCGRNARLHWEIVRLAAGMPSDHWPAVVMPNTSSLDDVWSMVRERMEFDGPVTFVTCSGHRA